MKKRKAFSDEGLDRLSARSHLSESERAAVEAMRGQYESDELVLGLEL
jgi:hypothetical protein